MVSITGTRGKAVQVQLLGINETLTYLRLKGMEIKSKSDLGVAKAATFVRDEVKESIIGNRGLPKTVDTGTFANSITAERKSVGVWEVKPRRVTYPRGNTTTEDIATFFEYGTTKIKARPHFGKTREDTRDEVTSIIKKEVRKI